MKQISALSVNILVTFVHGGVGGKMVCVKGLPYARPHRKRGDERWQLKSG